MLHSSDSPSLLLETIKSEDGIISNLHYHQQRCNQSRKFLYGSTDILNLETLLHPPSKGLFRCRVVYGPTLKSVEYIPYVPKNISTLKIVPATFTYDFKYANRDTFTDLLALHSDADDIIIEKEGYLTDTSMANIAFFDGKKWITPARPLLKGTMREKLLQEGFLHTKEIKKSQLSDYTQVALMNAMIGFKILDFDVKGINYDD